jgi:hypothetical protein
VILIEMNRTKVLTIIVAGAIAALTTKQLVFPNDHVRNDDVISTMGSIAYPEVVEFAKQQYEAGVPLSEMLNNLDFEGYMNLSQVRAAKQAWNNKYLDDQRRGIEPVPMYHLE